MRETQKKRGKSFYIMVGFLTLLTVSTVFLAISSSSKGAVLVALEDQIADLEKENRQLKESLIGESSLSIISNQAQSLGFLEPENIVYLTKQKPVAQLP